MNDKYERTETYHNKCEHDIREFKKRIDQLEEELNEAKQYRDTLELVNSTLRDDLLKALKTIGKLQAEYDFTKQFIIDNDMQWHLLSEYDKWKKARGE